MRFIKEISFDQKSKIVISATFSMFWLMILSSVTTLNGWLIVSLSVFGFLYHKLFTLIDEEVFPSDRQFIIEPVSNHHLYRFVDTNSNSETNFVQETKLRLLKQRLDLEKLANVHVFLGDGNESLDIFYKVFSKDIYSLAITSLSELQFATIDLKYLYIDISDISEREMKEISMRVKRINDKKNEKRETYAICSKKRH